ncbi:MAG: EamA family transporter [Spirochaetales bacterium]|nr:EamA family transporter [Spirochaetales bacterium]
MNMWGEVLLIIMAIITASGQMLIKKGAVHIIRNRGFITLILSFIDPYLLAGLFFTLTAPLLYIRALSSLDLGKAFMFNSLTHLLVFLSGRFILKERTNIFHWLGLSLVTAGFLLPAFTGLSL